MFDMLKTILAQYTTEPFTADSKLNDDLFEYFGKTVFLR